MISIKSLHKYFNKNKQNEIHVINDINLDLPEQGMVALFGRSGCGKTTLLNAIGGLDKTHSGSILIDGKDARKNPDVIRNQYIGYIFQNYNLNNQQTCFENVANALRLCGMTNKAEIEERVMAALANVGMDKYKSRTPDTLSGGQMQRIAIARAIVKNPKIILADEPTGNLDEANTIQVMDLLKKIAESHLVILVTHEANLVDFYCDKVIELSDGKIVSTRDNHGANGYAARSKNDIYLGEFDKAEATAGGVNVEYYGNLPKTPVKIRLVNNGGKIYLSVDDESIQILDRSSEVKLREGVYTEVERAEENKANIDMSKLPPIQGSHFGRLFNFAGSFKSGYNANFKKNKKSTKALRACMFLFSLVLVFMSANFGTAFKTIDDVKTQYNQNMFYVYTPSSDISNKINAAVGQHGIDNISLSFGVPTGNGTLTVFPGRFESFETEEASFKASAALLDIKFAGTPKVLAGRADGLTDKELVITSVLADRLIEASTVGYVKSYADLIGLSAKFSGMNLYIDRQVLIVGVIQSEESVAYRSSLADASSVMQSLGLYETVKVNKHSTLSLNSGETYLILGNENNTVGLPSKNEPIKINGKDFKIKDVISYYNSYDQYIYSIGSPLLKPYNAAKPEEGYYRISMDEYFLLAVQQKFYPEHPNIKNYENWEYSNRLHLFAQTYVKDNFFSEHPNIYDYQWSEDENEKAIYAEFDAKVTEYKKNDIVIQMTKNAFSSDYPDDTNVDNYQLFCEYKIKTDEYMVANFTEYYDEYYKHLDGYVKHNHIVRPEIYSWLYIEKGFEQLKYNNIWDTEYFYILVFRAENGRDPTYSEFENTERSELANGFKDDFSNLYNQYNDEFYQTNPGAYNSQNSYLLSEADYLSLATAIGESHESLYPNGSNGLGGGIIIGGGKAVATDDKAVPDGAMYYTVIHSTNHEATKAFVEQFSGTQVPEPKYQKAVYTPDIMFDDFMEEFKGEVITNIILLIVFLAIMSLCMYFIMKSSLMARIKEVGIYRAIGVSKGNLTFRFLIEAIVLTTFTVFIGYLISSAFIFALAANVSLLDSILYYPVWLAGAILVILYVVCLICGMLPIASLLRKTPSEILSKYDI